MKKYCVQVSPHTFQSSDARLRDRVDGLLAGHVDDVERGSGEVRELDRTVRRLALELRRPGQRVVERRRVAGGERLLDEHVDHVAVLGVHHHERTGLRRNLHRAEERLVVDHAGRPCTP